MLARAHDGIEQRPLLGGKLEEFPRDALDIVGITQSARALYVGGAEALLDLLEQLVERGVIPIERLLVYERTIA